VAGPPAGSQAATLSIDPGCPWQNGFGERFNGTLRDECYSTIFHNLPYAGIVEYGSQRYPVGWLDGTPDGIRTRDLHLERVMS
jgi:transposase InsO family protein